MTLESGDMFGDSVEALVVASVSIELEGDNSVL